MHSYLQPKVPMYMLSPAEINWQLKVYFQLRRDLRELGFGPFGCPSNLNTGLHAILMAQHLCEQASHPRSSPPPLLDVCVPVHRPWPVA